MHGQLCQSQVSFNSKDRDAYPRVTKDEQEHFEIRQPGGNFRKLDFEPNVSIISRQHPVKSELLEICSS